MEAKLALGQKQTLTAAMRTSVHILQLGALQLQDYVQELMSSNVVVELNAADVPSGIDWYMPRRAASSHGGRTDRAAAGPERAAFVDPWDLDLQIATSRLDGAQKRVLKYLVDTLDDNGFLGEAPEATAKFFGIREADVWQCVEELQSFDPPGIGARDLRECLLLQLRRSGRDDAVAAAIIQNHLKALSKQKYSLIARELRVSPERVEKACAVIRTLNPRPLNGKLRKDEPVCYIVPDFFVIESEGVFLPVMNERIVPHIKMDGYYLDLIKSDSLSPEARAYLRAQYKQANEVSGFIRFRSSTLFKVARYVVERQQNYFRYGPGYRAAMNNREISDALGLHDSTISRAVNNKFFACKWGCFSLKSLFSHGIQSTTDNEAIDSDEVLKHLQLIVAQEPRGNAHSDQRIAEIMQEQGINISRRTIAKYRSALNIPNAFERNALAQ